VLGQAVKDTHYLQVVLVAVDFKMRCGVFTVAGIGACDDTLVDTDVSV
jgi:hypothetical protein